MATPIEVLCWALPYQFTSYLNYVRSLRYEEKPDYGYLKRLFKELFIRNSYKLDYLYDWCLLAKKSESVVNYTNSKINIQILNTPSGVGVSQLCKLYYYYY